MHSHCCAIESNRSSLIEARSSLRHPRVHFLLRKHWFKGSMKCWVAMEFNIDVLIVDISNGICTGAVVDDATSARHWKRCSTKLLVPAVKLSAPPTCPSKACGCAAASFTGHSKYRIGCEDTYECSRCFKRHALCSLCHKLVPFIHAQRHYTSCLRKEHTKGEKWASFF